MQQLLEFVANHPLLSGAFVAVLLLLVWTEIQRRGQGFRMLAPSEAVAFINRQNAVVVDVSSSADFNGGHIVGARNLSLSRLKDPDREVAKLRGKPVLVVCKTGQSAQQGAQSLVRLGASEVAVLKGGMAQWKSESYPVTRSKG